MSAGKFQNSTEAYAALESFYASGACRSTDVTLFFPGKDGEVGGWSREENAKAAAAKEICFRCPVMQDCLDYAMTYGESFGIWGGMTTRERNKLRRDRERRGLT